YIIILMLLSVYLLQAQIPVISFWNNIRNSSYTQNNEINIRCETIDLPGLETEMFYSTQSGWENIEMINLNGLTYEAIIPALPAETQFCRFRTETDTIVGMMPAYQQNDLFPPENELGFIATDPSGDNLDPESPNLDITGNYFGYSNSRFYAGLTSESGDFPLDVGGSFPITYYFYVTTILNPETVLIDSVIYAMIYADIPMLLSPGLYKISGTEFSLETFELIGNIETEVVNGQLQMACDIETLTSDENFGDWPNITNSIGVEMLTAEYTLPTEFLLTDLAKISLQFIDQYEIEPIVNILPEISELNGTNGGLFTCNYFDENGHFPITAEVIVDGIIFQLNPLGFDYSGNVIFENETGSYGWDEATFRFSDNNYEFVEETIINNTSSDEELPIVNSALRNYPNPFNPTTTISFSVTQTSSFVNLEIYNLKGQKVKEFDVILNGVEGESNSIVWNGTDSNDQPVSSGIYLYQLNVDNKTVANKKMLLMK
ncbi:MAG: T9SS type A sorting domain-containing protein, partial [Candidatus Cloacimonetes bacterium]|nr:T9SS type A sorting domain-containing protein [Candidatus Cloacimonadota bacterium]